MAICSKCGLYEATDMGLCRKCLAEKNRKGRSSPTFEEFKEIYLNNPTSGLFWADDALLQYEYYKEDTAYLPYIEGEFGADYREEHRKLCEWYTEKFFDLLNERLKAVKDTSSYSDEEVKALFLDFIKYVSKLQLYSAHHAKATTRSPSDRAFISVTLKRYIRDFYGKGYQKNPAKYPCPDVVDIAGDTFDPGSGLYFIELFFQIQNYDYVGELIEAVKSNSPKQLIELADRFKLTLNPWNHQNEAINAWINAKHNGVIEMATATGKTLVGMLAIEELVKKHAKTGQPQRAMVICHSRVLLNQWRREIIRKMGVYRNETLDYSHPLTAGGVQIDFITVQSLQHKYVNYSPDLIIIDEVHHIAAPKFRKALLVNSPWQIGLTAQLVDPEARRIIKEELGDIVYQYPIEQALRDGIIPTFKWIVHPVYLDIAEETEFNEITRQIMGLFNNVRNDSRTIHGILHDNNKYTLKNLGEFIWLTKLARYRDYNLPEEWKVLQVNIHKRREIINKSKPRLNKTIELAKQLGNDHKVILFLMDIESCNLLGAKLQESVENVFVLHSEIKEDPIRVVEKFKNAENGILIGANMLNEGIDIPSADIGINVAFTKSELQLIQRMGRVLRKDRNKKPTFYQFVSITDQTAYLDIMDANKFVDDLAWVEATGLKMGLNMQIVWESNELISYRNTVEEFWRINTADENISEKIGTFHQKSALSEFTKTAIKRIPDLLDLYPEPTITDEQWNDLIRCAHSMINDGRFVNDEKTRFVNISKAWYIYVLCERRVDKLRNLFVSAGNNILSGEEHPLPEMGLDANGMLIPKFAI